MNIKDKLTIVIPCYNEENYIERTITSIVQQINIAGTRVIIADGFSKDKTRAKIISLRELYKDIIKIELVNGGKVAYARNFGANLVRTKYVLFLDADSVLFDFNTIDRCLYMMQHQKLHLLTCNIKSITNDIRAKFSFSLFNFVNKVMSNVIPFAIGGFFLTRMDRFKEYGGFDESLNNSEDFWLSRQYDKNKFKIAKFYYGQDDRRFKKMGYFGMIKLLILSFINRNNLDHFKKDVGYW